MEFGMFHEFPSLPGRTDSEAFDEAMEQVEAPGWLNQIRREALVKQRTQRHQTNQVRLGNIGRACLSRELGTFP